jgi:hypothetical protein
MRYSLFQPEIAIMVYIAYTIVTWSYFYVFHMLSEQFLWFGPGRTETDFDSFSGLRKPLRTIMTCMLNNMTENCRPQLTQLLDELDAISDTPIVYFWFSAMSTWGQWVIASVVAVANYIFAAIGTAIIYNFIHIKVHSDQPVSQTFQQVLFVVLGWVAFSFTIYFSDFYLALTGAQMLLFSSVGDFVGQRIVMHHSMNSKRSKEDITVSFIPPHTHSEQLVLHKQPEQVVVDPDLHSDLEGDGKSVCPRARVYQRPTFMWKFRAPS